MSVCNCSNGLTICMEQDGGGGGNPFANMGDLMANVKRAQELVKVEGAKVQEELAA